MFYNSSQDEISKEETKKERIKLRRDLISKKEVLRREELRHNKLDFEYRNLLREEDQLNAEVSDKESSLKRIADELRMLRETVVAREKAERNLNEEIKIISRKTEEFRRRKEELANEVGSSRTEMARIANEIKVVENEIKKI